MIEIEKFSRSNAKRLVLKKNIQRTFPGDLYFPSEQYMEMRRLSPSDEIWVVAISVKIGLDRSQFILEYFDSQQVAEKFASQYPLGGLIAMNDQPQPFSFEYLFKEGGRPDSYTLSSGGDPNCDHIYDILIAVGVIDESKLEVTSKVLDWAGSERVNWAKSMEPDNWEVLIQIEYCSRHFPRSSLAFLAAQFNFNYFISGDEYSSGYLMREIEAILGGAEDLAEDLLLTRKRAGEAGRRVSQQAKASRLDMFMCEIEKLADLIGRMSEQMILDQAFQNAVRRDPVLWRQGAGRQADYETILRSDATYCARYYRVFTQTA